MKKIAIIHGDLDTPLQRKAIALLSELILDYTLEYPICIPVSKADEFCGYFRIFVGTSRSNEYIREHSRGEMTHAEQYSIKVKDQNAIIEGSDDAGAVYGCIDFYNKYLIPLEFPHDPNRYRLNPFDRDLPDFEHSSYPSIKRRGIWTWGHVIYDYRGFIDNMVKLKLNTLIIWNDHPPINARDIVEYAHAHNIKLIWGYSWLWDTNCGEFSIDFIEGSVDEIVKKCEEEYLPLGGDGIYFQSFTETCKEYVGGVLIADAVTHLVNTAASRIFEGHPDLELQFGLHSESVKNKLDFIKKVDPRVRIVWENCGAFPFSYIPKRVENFDETVDFVKKIAHLRDPDERFGVVTKGLIKLDWGSFEHLEGPMNIGVCSEKMAKNRIERKRKIWRYIQAYWLTYAPKAHEMARVLCEEKNGDLDVTALVEDAMFEKQIVFPAALYAEMLWDVNADTMRLINEVALRDYVDFV